MINPRILSDVRSSTTSPRERAVLVRECSRRTVRVDEREAYGLMCGLLDAARALEVVEVRRGEARARTLRTTTVDLLTGEILEQDAPCILGESCQCGCDYCCGCNSDRIANSCSCTPCPICGLCEHVCECNREICGCHEAWCDCSVGECDRVDCCGHANHDDEECVL